MKTKLVPPFVVGQEVVCGADYSNHPIIVALKADFPRRGTRYRVREIFYDALGSWRMTLREVRNGKFPFRDGLKEPTFNADEFSPHVDRGYPQITLLSRTKLCAN